jgi:phthiodiolone/phenolphthiodiolone dimycocerosates ketoreductase
MREVLTAVPIPLDRRQPAAELAELARALQASGVVDHLHLWDQLSWFFPPALWTPENTPLARVFSDAHSFPDAFMLAGYLLNAAPGMGAVISTDAVRRGPAELVQSMLTLGELTGGRAIVQVGAGEAKQCAPFGWKRSQGLGRLEDLLNIVGLLYQADGPVDYAGHHTTFRNASVGDTGTRRPRLWALGGGPRLLDLATSHADGMAYLAPHAWDTPERAQTEVARLKQQLESKGRDPDSFHFGVWVSAVLHEDPDVIAGALANPLMRWMAAVFGRVNLRDWAALGVESALPPDYHYAMNLLPMEVDATEAQRVVARVSTRQQRLSWMHGDPKQVGATLREFADAGVTWFMIADVLPMTFPPDDPAVALRRTLDVCAALKGRSCASSSQAAAASLPLRC